MLDSDYATRKLRGIGEHRGGLFYLVNKPFNQGSQQVMSTCNKVMSQLFVVSRDVPCANAVHKQLDFSIWHKRLLHAPVSKLRYVDVVPKPSQ